MLGEVKTEEWKSAKASADEEATPDFCKKTYKKMSTATTKKLGKQFFFKYKKKKKKTPERWCGGGVGVLPLHTSQQLWSGLSNSTAWQPSILPHLWRSHSTRPAWRHGEEKDRLRIVRKQHQIKIKATIIKMAHCSDNNKKNVRKFLTTINLCV